MTRDREVVINSDNIYIAGEPDKFVMMEWETPLMKKHAEVVTKNGGDILEIGFGMGISSNFIHQSVVKSHTIIELKKDIYQKALEWSKDKPNVKVIFGDWFFLAPLIILNKYDGIFYDADCSNLGLFKNKIVDKCIKEFGIFSFFDPKLSDVYGYRDNIKKELVIINDIPKNLYHNEKECWCPWVEYPTNL